MLNLMDTQRMRISCRRCQLRKLKCTRVRPCGSCVASSSECVFRDDDTRRRPVSRNYVAALEERIASYETTLRSLQQATPEQRQTILDHAVEGNNYLAPRIQTAPFNPIFDYQGSSRRSTLTLQPGPQGSLSFYGPTSIYQKDCITAKNTGTSYVQSDHRLEQWQDFRLARSLNVPEATIHRGLSKVFSYLASECLFLHPETFAEDFFSHHHNNKYWSFPLLYALSSLGARLGADPGDMRDADSLVHCAHEMSSISSLETPHVTVVQSLLSLAFVELGAANHVKGWMLAGMAFRMGQDMGLHQDPRFLTDQDTDITITGDFQIRRRVYWGCYVADKMISLYLGRPMMLHEMDAAVNPPDLSKEQSGHGFIGASPASIGLEGTNSQAEYFSDLFGVNNIEQPIYDRASSFTVFVHIVELSKIIESVMTLIFSTKMIKTPRKELVMGRVANVEELNVRLFRWQSSIPEDLAWNQWTPTTQKLLPQAAIMHTLYHSTMISLNRHFIRPTPGFARRSQSREICIASAESIMAMIRQYRGQHTLANAPLTLVYSAIMAATAVSFALDSAPTGQAPPPEFETHMKFLHKALKELSGVYRVALDASARLETALYSQGQKTSEPGQSNLWEDDSKKDDHGSLFEWVSWEGLSELRTDNDEPLTWGLDVSKDAPDTTTSYPEKIPTEPSPELTVRTEVETELSKQL
ncbi:fungal-specific transcription factor domain-containing protein [Xylariales sp. PMI_506]|nr:fungal-specific transcription factor domain-containing protein [Xylariales sp. PMI_506]